MDLIRTRWFYNQRPTIRRFAEGGGMYGVVSAGEDNVLVSGHLGEGDVVCVTERDCRGLFALRRLARVEE